MFRKSQNKNIKRKCLIKIKIKIIRKNPKKKKK